MKLVSGDPAEMTVLHAGYVLQQCFDVALPAHIETLVGLNFLDGVPRAGRLGIEFRGGR